MKTSKDISMVVSKGEIMKEIGELTLDQVWLEM